ncbi:MAG: flagellar basal body rod protein FlgB [Ignavibacteriaceae bacterium]
MPVSVIKQLETFANFCVEKNKVISKNIANTGTENYRREDVVFKNILSESMSPSLKGTESKHFGALASVDQSAQNFEVVLDNSIENISGANNVDIDKEMAELADNTLKFKFVSKMLGDYYRNIQEVIKGSR